MLYQAEPFFVFTSIYPPKVDILVTQHLEGTLDIQLQFFKGIKGCICIASRISYKSILFFGLSHYKAIVCLRIWTYVPL